MTRLMISASSLDQAADDLLAPFIGRKGRVQRFEEGRDPWQVLVPTRSPGSPRGASRARKRHAEVFRERWMKKERRRLNLRALQAFEAVARHLSVTAAAVELGITQSAVSHQLRSLREELGEPLLQKHGRHIELTETGRRLAASLDSAFDLLEKSALARAQHRATVRVAAYSSFAVGWLIPALRGFLENHPDIDLRLVMLYDPHEISSGIADVFITSEPVRPGYRVTRLFPERLVPVVDGASTCEPGALPRLITAEVDPALAGRDWEAFAALNDIPLATDMPFLCCTHYIFSLEMVRAGLGAALIPEFLALLLLAKEQLRRLPGKALPTGQTYDVHVRQDRRSDVEIVGFVTWLRRELRLQRFEA